MLSIPTPTRAGRTRALHDFLRSWYGIDTAATPHHAAPPACPHAVAEWMAILAAHPRLAGVQNELVSPTREEIDPFVRHVGPSIAADDDPKHLWMFYVENQGVFTSGCELDGDDPRVWTRSEWRPALSSAWKQEPEPFTGYLLSAVLLEATYGASHGGAWTIVARDDFERLDQLEPLPLAPMAIGVRFYTAPDVLIAASTADGPELEVMFGSNVEDALAFAEDLVGDPWEAGIRQ